MIATNFLTHRLSPVRKTEVAVKRAQEQGREMRKRGREGGQDGL